MGFSNEIYAQAIAMKLKQKDIAEYRAEEALEKLYKKNPQLSELDRALTAAGAMAATLALSGDSEKLDELSLRAATLNEKKKAILAACPEATPKYCCEKCNDTGKVNGKYCDCVYMIAKELAYGQLCADMPLDECSLADFSLSYYPTAKNEDGVSPRARMKEIFELAKKYAEKFTLSSGNLLFLGGVGLGKTHLSLGIARKVLEKGYGVIYGPAPSLLAAAEREHFSKENNGAMDSYLNCDLLIIDDLGTEFSTQFTVSVINDVINTRMLKKLPTIISTNLSLQELMDRYSDRVASRIIGSYTMRQFLGNDVRQIKALEKNK